MFWFTQDLIIHILLLNESTLMSFRRHWEFREVCFHHMQGFLWNLLSFLFFFLSKLGHPSLHLIASVINLMGEKSLSKGFRKLYILMIWICRKYHSLWYIGLSCTNYKCIIYVLTCVLSYADVVICKFLIRVKNLLSVTFTNVIVLVWLFPFCNVMNIYISLIFT